MILECTGRKKIKSFCYDSQGVTGEPFLEYPRIRSHWTSATHIHTIPKLTVSLCYSRGVTSFKFKDEQQLQWLPPCCTGHGLVIGW